MVLSVLACLAVVPSVARASSAAVAVAGTSLQLQVLAGVPNPPESSGFQNAETFGLVPGRFGNLEPVRGTVLVRLPGTQQFVRIETITRIPVGTLVDARNGVGRLFVDNGDEIQQAVFSRGTFRFEQTRLPANETVQGPVLFVAEAILEGGSFRGCGARVASARRATARASGVRARAAARSRRIVRRLSARGSGRFRTRGRYAAAIVRGTSWTIHDRCDGTLVKVRSGAVKVHNLVTNGRKVVRAGNQYFARAPS